MTTHTDRVFSADCEFINNVNAVPGVYLTEEFNKLFYVFENETANKNKTASDCMVPFDKHLCRLRLDNYKDIAKTWYLIAQCKIELANVSRGDIEDTDFFDDMSLAQVARELVENNYFGDIAADSKLLDYIDYNQIANTMLCYNGYYEEEGDFCGVYRAD